MDGQVTKCPLFQQLSRYLAVATIALVADVAILLSLVELLGIPVWVAAIAGFCIGLVVSYVLSIRWVFESHSGFGSRSEFLVFGIIGWGGVAITEAIFTAGAALSVDYRFAKGIAVGVVFLWNFWLRRILLSK